MNPSGVKAVAIAGNLHPDFVGDFDGADAVCKALFVSLVFITADITGKDFRLFALVVAHSGLELGAHDTGLECNSARVVHGSGLAFFFCTVFTLNRFWRGVVISLFRITFEGVKAGLHARA